MNQNSRPRGPEPGDFVAIQTLALSLIHALAIGLLTGVLLKFLGSEAVSVNVWAKGLRVSVPLFIVLHVGHVYRQRTLAFLTHPWSFLIIALGGLAGFVYYMF